MGTLRSIEARGKGRRREPRTDIDLGLTVWGVDTRGDRFLQEARARDISLSGALIIGLDTELRSGDVIGVLVCRQEGALPSGMGSREWDESQSAGCSPPHRAR